MKLIVGGAIGLSIGSTLGWLGFGSVPGAIGLGCALAACIYGVWCRISASEIINPTSDRARNTLHLRNAGLSETPNHNSIGLIEETSSIPEKSTT